MNSKQDTLRHLDHLLACLEALNRIWDEIESWSESSEGSPDSWFQKAA